MKELQWNNALFKGFNILTLPQSNIFNLMTETQIMSPKFINSGQHFLKNFFANLVFIEYEKKDFPTIVA